MNKYDSIEFITRGSIGDIYSAYHGDKKVIIKKIYNREHAMIEEKISRIINCSSMYLLCLLDSFIHNGAMHLVYEYISGAEDLFSCIFETRRIQDWSNAKILHFMYLLCEGLSALHKHKILHLDIKPENIIIKDDEIPIIIDYDLSCVDKDCAKMSLGGTPGYIPEEILKRKTIGSSADIFALGCVFYSILCDEIPEQDPITRISNLQGKKTFKFKRLEFFENKLGKLLKKMLSEKPDKRLPLKKIKKKLIKISRSL